MSSSDELKEKYYKKQKMVGKELRGRWDRVLPLDEMLSDRWKKAQLLNFGEGTSVYENVYVYGKPKIGKNVKINPFVILDATGGLEIGDGCSIASQVMIFTHSTHLKIVSEGKQGIIHKPVKIGKYTQIGSGAMVMYGVTIGHHSIISAGAVVTKDIPSYSVAAGIPATVIGKIKKTKKGVKVVYEDK